MPVRPSAIVVTALLTLSTVTCGPEEATSVELQRGVYDVTITAIDEGCDAPRSTEGYSAQIEPDPEGAFYLPFMISLNPMGSFAVEGHHYEPIAGRPGFYASVTGPQWKGDCGAWEGTLSEVEVAEEEHVTATLTLEWTPAQVCLGVPNVPSGACTSVLEYDFKLAMACPAECSLKYVGHDLTCDCP